MVWWRCFHTDIDIYYTYDFNFSNSFFLPFPPFVKCLLFVLRFVFFFAFIILSIVWTESSFSLAYVFIFCFSATFCVIFFCNRKFFAISLLFRFYDESTVWWFNLFTFLGDRNRFPLDEWCRDRNDKTRICSKLYFPFTLLMM